MADEKVLGFSIVINGVSNEAMELQKLTLQLQNLNKEYKDLQKTVKDQGGLASNTQLQQLAALNNEIDNHKTQIKELDKIQGFAKDSLNRMRTELIKLKDDYANASAEVREKMTPGINKLTGEVSKAEQAIGVHSRGVGSYTQSIVKAAGSLIGFVSPIALVTVALGKLKEAFFATEEGLRFQTRFTAGMKTFFQELASGNVWGAFFDRNVAKAQELADKMNELRIEERNESYKVADLETKNLLLRQESARAGITEAEQIKILTQVEKNENGIIKIKKDHLAEELLLIQAMLVLRPKDTQLLDQYTAKMIELNRVDAEHNLRVAGRLASFGDKKEKQDLIDLTDTQIEKERALVIAKQEAMRADQRMKFLPQNGPIFGLTGVLAVKIKKDTQETVDDIGNIIDKANKNMLKDGGIHDRAMLDMAKKTAESKMNIENSAITLLTAIAGKSKSIQKAALIAERAVAIAEIITKARIANMATTAWGAAYAIPTFGASLVAAVAINAKNTIAEVFNIGAVVAATVTGLAGFARGGYTKPGSKNTPAGIVHAGEWVASQEMVNSRETGPIISALERKRATLAGSGVMNRTSPFAYASGGYVGQQAPIVPAAGFDYERLAELIPKYIVLDINKVNQAQSELAVIITANRI